MRQALEFTRRVRAVRRLEKRCSPSGGIVTSTLTASTRKSGVHYAGHFSTGGLLLYDIGDNSRSLKHSVAGSLWRLSGLRVSQVQPLTPDENGTCRRWPLSLVPGCRLRCKAWSTRILQRSIRTMLQRLLKTCDVTRKESRRCSNDSFEHL